MKCETDTKCPTPERLEEDIQLLKEWMLKEPHLPKVEDEWLRIFYYHHRYRLEETKIKIDNYFSFRNKYPEVLKNRNPLGSDIAQNRVAVSMGSPDRLTKDGGRIIFMRLESDPSIYDVTAHLKRFFMIAEVFFFDTHKYCGGVIDFQNLCYRHVLRGFPGIKMAIEIFLKAYSSRFRAIHIINLPSALDQVSNKMKPLLPAAFMELVYFHSSSAELCKMVDEDIVCSDFGGKGPSLSQYDEYVMRLLEQKEDWFIQQNSICTNEELRRKSEQQFEEMKGSFRKLQID